VPAALPFFFFPGPMVPATTEGLVDEEGVDVEAAAVSGERERNVGDDELSRSMKDAVDDSRSLDGTFD
jgi:hypothetical protein